ncbi:uncharacterized protein LOC113558856 [Rhopalosiphum maidis]|uniref:uncharacterized protein LOC113558856 n=1 Tax=Rhopalosiphum maidis TaxID=43146 RepID=UPI000EFEBA77|nr:uncharacterized protein LOC113558856 [Rhopalosiphum maidis]
MPRACSVVGCTTGYKSNRCNISTFSFPKNNNLRQKWINAIPNKNVVVNKNSAVCANHFLDDQIIRTWTSGTGDKQVCINFKYPKLKKDAIPCMFFPERRYLSTPQTNIQSHGNQDCTLNKLISENIKVIEVKPEVKSEVSESSSSDDLDPEFVQSPVLSTEHKFENICCDLESTGLPNNWKYEIHRGKKPYIVLYTIKCNNYDAEIIIEKQIFLESDMIMKFKIYDMNITLQDLCQNSNISSLHELISIMNILNSKKVCAGGPLIREFEGITVKCANIIAQKHWQHKKCPYLIDMSYIKCSFCETLRSIFHMKRSRLRLKKSTKLFISLAKKKRLEEYRNKNISHN